MRYCNMGRWNFIVVFMFVTIVVIQLVNGDKTSVLNNKCEITLKPKQSGEVRWNAQCDCGRRNMQRIVGGEETELNEFTSMAAMVNKNPKNLLCGATIVGIRVALTLASCLWRQDLENLRLLIGDHDFTTRNETDSGLLLLIEDTILHEGYIVTKSLYDVGVVITKYDIEFTDKVGPACLPYRLDSLIGKNVILVGWGKTTPDGVTSNILHKTTVKVISQNLCQLLYHDKFDLAQHLCTFAKGKDACKPDFGGPLYYQDERTGRLFLAGMMNYGKDCTGLPLASINVRNFLEWIDEKLPNGNFCRA